MEKEKQAHLHKYLEQQQPQQSQQHVVLYEDPNECNLTMDEFKVCVRKWFELDNVLKKIQEMSKEKRKEKNKISEVIMKFMCKYNIEDLNTKEGRIRCKQAYVKAPLNKELVKQRISEYVPEAKREEVITKIYDERDKVERTTLRRLRIT